MLKWSRPGVGPPAFPQRPPPPAPPPCPWGSREITLLGLQAQHCRPHHSFGIAVEWFRPGPTVQTVPKPPTLQTVLNFRAPRPQNCRQCHTFGPPGPPAAHDEIAGMVSSRFPPGPRENLDHILDHLPPKIKIDIAGPGSRGPGTGARARSPGLVPGAGARDQGPRTGPGAWGPGLGPGARDPGPAARAIPRRPDGGRGRPTISAC